MSGAYNLYISCYTAIRCVTYSGAFPAGKLNAMIKGALDCTKGDEDELIAEIDAFSSVRKASA